MVNQTCGSLRPETSFINTLRPRQNGRHFADDIFKCIFLNENVWISIKISLKFIPKGPINNIPALVKIMAWRRPGDKPLSEAMIVNLPTHICVFRPQWVKLSLHWPPQYTKLGILWLGLNINLWHSRPTADSQAHSRVFCGEFVTNLIKYFRRVLLLHTC